MDNAHRASARLLHPDPTGILHDELVRALGDAPERNETIYDRSLPGFCARRQHSADVVFWFRYRFGGRERWFRIGRHGAPWLFAEAREEAKRLFKAVTRGEDPAGAKRDARAAVTVADLCDMYWRDVTSGRLLMRSGRPKKQSTLYSDRGRIENNIKPLLGHLPVASVTRRDIEAFLHAIAEGKTARRSGTSIVRGGKGVASRTLITLSAIMRYGIGHELLTVNPVHAVTPFASNPRTRRLADDEYRTFAEALQAVASRGHWPAAIAAVKFLALTGWRSGEAFSLRWPDVDLAKRVAVLPDTKSGRSVRLLSCRALAVIAAQPKVAGSDLVFPGTVRGRRYNSLPRMWSMLREHGLSEDVTPNTLRHSFASLADDLGFSEHTGDALLGHKSSSVTGSYIYRGDRMLLAAADEVAERVAELMDEKARPSTPEPPPLCRRGRRALHRVGM